MDAGYVRQSSYVCRHVFIIKYISEHSLTMTCILQTDHKVDSTARTKHCDIQEGGFTAGLLSWTVSAYLGLI